GGVLGRPLLIVIMVILPAMVIVVGSWTQSLGWNAQCCRDRLQHSFRWSPQPVLDLGEVGVRDAGHRRDLTHRQLSQLSLPANEFAHQILRRLRPWIHGHHPRESSL